MREQSTGNQDNEARTNFPETSKGPAPPRQRHPTDQQTERGPVCIPGRNLLSRDERDGALCIQPVSEMASAPATFPVNKPIRQLLTARDPVQFLTRTPTSLCTPLLCFVPLTSIYVTTILSYSITRTYNITWFARCQIHHRLASQFRCN